MRKLFFLLPLLFVPAFASAAHNAPLEDAAYRLEVNASRFYKQVTHLRGNRRLKAEARQFAVLSDRLARQASYKSRTPRLRRTLARLDSAYFELQSAVRRAAVPGNKKRLRKGFGKLTVALNNVENQVWRRARAASARSGGRYVFMAYRSVGPDARIRRYRD